MSALAHALLAELDDAALDQLADALAPRIAARTAAPIPPYLTPQEAGEYLRATKQRVYDLVSSGRLKRVRDGGRSLIRRDDLDAYLAGGDRP